jgi:vacuolar protein sorting-associated protein 54
MEKDIEYLNNRLSKINGFGETGNSLLAIVRAKKAGIATKTDEADVKNGEGGEEPKDSEEKPTETANEVSADAVKETT